MDNRPETHYLDEKWVLNYDNRTRRIKPAYNELHEMVNFLLQSLLPFNAYILVVGAGTGMDIKEREMLGAKSNSWFVTLLSSK